MTARAHTLAADRPAHLGWRIAVGGMAFTAAMLGAAMANAESAPYTLGTTIPASLTFSDASGKIRTFGEFRGSPVVLEWTNPGCPFVKKHYSGGHMQQLQAEAVAGGANWITINSGAAGKQGYLNPATAEAEAKTLGYKSSVVVPDPEGKLGKAFGAETTPHMYILDKNGKLAYMGAIDSIPSFDKADVAKADNYVTKALAELKAGKAVTNAQTKSYGCSVKY
jgi:AhpC/TSA family